MRLEYLNHACVLIRVGDVALLSDPWLSGSAFADGWGLRQDNPDALALAATATHLWISHWHSDHLHAPTLGALAKLRPDMTVIANVSSNFTMEKRLAGFGFRNIVPLGERTALQLDGRVRVTRHPTAGIDNALHLEAPGWSILNYNDCNLPAAAISALRRRIGPIDLLLTNYNHAGKLFELPEAATIRDDKWRIMDRTVDLLQPTWVLPFASGHYYRAPYSTDQNASLLDTAELRMRTTGDPRYLPLGVGEALQWSEATRPPVTEAAASTPPDNIFEVHDYGPPVPWDELLAAARDRCGQISSGFGPLARLLPPLRIALGDHGRTLTLTRGGPTDGDGQPPHIETHSVALMSWLGRRFGDDTFVAGAHFSIADPDTRAIERWALFTLLDASHMDPRRSLLGLTTPAGLGFWWARREELVATVLGGHFRAGQMRL